MFKKVQLTFCLSLLACLNAWAHVGADYKRLKYWDMCSRGIKQEGLQDDVAQEVGESKEPDFTLPSIDELDRTLMTYDILQHSTTDYFTPKGITQEQQDSLDILYRDLEVYTGDGKHPEVNIANILGRTWSSAGSAVLRNMLRMPLAAFDQTAFKARQALIQELAHNDAFFEQVDSICRQWSDNEERMLSNWLDTDAVSNEVFEKCYYQKAWLKRLNNNPYAMETLTRLGNLGTTWTMVGDIALMFAFFTCTKKYGNNVSWREAFVQNVHASLDVIKNLNPVQYYRSCSEDLANFDRDFDDLWPQFRQAYSLGDSDKGAFRSTMRKAMKGGMCVTPVMVTLWGAHKAYQTKNAYHAAKQTKDAINFLQEKMIGMGNVVRSVQSLQALGGEHAVVADGLVSWAHVDDLLHHSQDDGFKKLVSLLDSNTFEGESSFFSLSGRVLAAHELMKAEKNKFAGAIEVVGELDACLSIAKLYRQYADRRVGYCFVELEKTAAPYMDIKGFWNPFVDHNVVVTNDIALGGESVEQNVVLTGSNTGGKSTVGLKGTLISLYLAHTFGIAPAESCNASIFTDFCSYLHILDSVASGESAFQAEINRAQSLIKAVNSLKEDEFAFIVIDELFKGTSPEKGAPGAYKVIKHLAGRKNVIFIIATHFKLLTELKDEVDSVKNMKLEIYEDENGNLVKPYKLEEGISTQNIADILMESGLDIADFDFE